MLLWTWYGYADPGQTIDKAVEDQIHALDSAQRKADIDTAQETMCAEAPLSVTVYPKLLQAINTGEWDGWIFNETGGDQAFFRSASQKSHLTVGTAETATAEQASSAWIWAAVAIAVAVIAVLAVVLVRRSRRAVEEG